MRPGNFVALPNQPIDSHGNIFIPYAGLIPAAGKTATQVDREIAERIKNRAIGEVNGATAFSPTGRVVPQPSGERLLVISPLFWVTIATTACGSIALMSSPGAADSRIRAKTRGWYSSGEVTEPRFGALIYEPGNNIRAWPNDTIYLYKEPQTFLAFGATGLQGQFPFSANPPLPLGG